MHHCVNEQVSVGEDCQLSTEVLITNALYVLLAISRVYHQSYVSHQVTFNLRIGLEAWLTPTTHRMHTEARRQILNSNNESC